MSSTTFKPEYAWYGDDFTGASDTLATLSQGGLSALLLLEPPPQQRWARLKGVQAIGLAGATRSMDPAAMRRALAPAVRFFTAIQPGVLHYKICSTFDSTPRVGNIAVALESLRPAASVPVTPILGGQPSLGRYCIFGNLYARAGQDGHVYRLDRHPTMSRHPVTPMKEADLLRHLQAQGLAGLLGLSYTDYTQAGWSAGQQAARWLSAGAASGHLHPVLDVSCDEDLNQAGAVLTELSRHGTVLTAGASSVAQAYLSQSNRLSPTPAGNLSPAEKPVLIVVGSQSPVTERQVALCRMADILMLDPVRLHASPGYAEQLQEKVRRNLQQGRHTLLKTQSADKTASTPEQLDTQSAGDASQPAAVLPALVVARDTANLIAGLTRRLRADGLLSRLCIAGGDTSSLGTQALGIWGLSYLGQVGPGVSLCQCHSDDELQGLELVLKGGQMGADDFFDRIILGGAADQN